MRRALSVLALGAVATACASHDCTDMGCFTQTTLRFESTLSGTETYVVTLRSDAEEFVCTNDGGTWGCNNSAWPFAKQDSTGEAATATTELDGVQVPGRSERYTVTVTLTKDDSVLLSQEVKPTYVGEELNGPGCGTCPQGEGVIEAP